MFLTIFGPQFSYLFSPIVSSLWSSVFPHLPGLPGEGC
jgi:hypothetical protein